jgi:tetratricopeptide (TPR) repeat protein
MKIEFVNRSKEFEFLEQHLKNLGVTNSIVLLCGESGVGKSELSKVFMDHFYDSIPSIKVPIQQAEKNSYTSGYYITKLAQLLNEIAKVDQRIQTLSSFFRMGTTSAVVKKKMTQNIAEDISELIPFSKTTKGLFDLIFAKGELDESNFFQSTQSDTLFALFEYVQFQLAQIPMIVNVENIQSIDERSLELLCALLATNKSLFLLEFTEKDNSGYTFSELISRFEEQPTFISTLFIEPLSIHDVRRIIESQPNITWEIIQNSYVNWNGNIRLLVDVLARHRYSMPVIEQPKFNLLEATRQHLISLSIRDLFVLIVIEVHKEPVQRSLLKQILNYKEAFQYVIDLDGSLEALDKHYLLKFSNDEFMLAHDSIRGYLNELERYVSLSLIAQSFWLNLYESLLVNGDLYSTRGWQLMKVLYFASLLDYIDKIFTLLDVIHDEAIKSRDPQKLILYVEDVKLCLIEKDENRYSERIDILCYWLTETWYNLGQSKKAWIQLEQIRTSSKKKNVFKAILLEQIGRHREAIQFCTEEIKLPQSANTNYELALRLVDLITSYALGDNGAAKRGFDYLYENEKFANFFEYGFLLRNAELIYSYQESLPYYLMSIEHFEKFGAIRQISFSRITYGVHLGLTGNIEEARIQFNQAALELGEVITERHTILNNMAVLLLFESNISSDTEILFRQALLTADSDFEKVAILNNYLVLLDWQKRNDDAQIAINGILRILSKPSFASKEIIRYAYFNIFKFYSGCGLIEKGEKFRLLVDSVGLNETPIWKFWLYNQAIPPDDEEAFLASIDRPISFLCNWNMEFDSNLMHYE